MRPDPTEKTPGEKLRAAREAAGLTQAEAARRLGMDVGTLSRKERGRSETTTTDLLAAEVAFGLGKTEAPPSGQVAQTGAGQSVAEQAAYWRGKQDTLLQIMKHIGVLHQEAVNTLSDISANTIPMPREPMFAGPETKLPSPTPEEIEREQREKRKRGKSA